jgi:DNA-directed RNA polymerase subunit D
MEVKILQKHNNHLRFFVTGISIPVANSIRRIIMSDVPAMAIDEVVIIENSSVMYDEVLAHRLGLIPLKTDLDSYVLPEVCSCGSELGCNKCSVSFTLNAEALSSIRTVYSGELKSINPDVAPASNTIPLLKLAPGQRIKLEAYAKLGIGKKHVKWQPVSVSSYKYVPEITINRRKCDNCGICVEVCPKDVLEIVQKKLEIVSEENCTLCKDCEVICPKSPSAIKIKNLKNSFIFNIESTGALPCERIVIEAINILKKKSKEFARQITKIKGKKKRKTKKVK